MEILLPWNLPAEGSGYNGHAMVFGFQPFSREVAGTPSLPLPPPTSAASSRTLLTCFPAAVPVAQGSLDGAHRAPSSAASVFPGAFTLELLPQGSWDIPESWEPASPFQPCPQRVGGGGLLFTAS